MGRPNDVALLIKDGVPPSAIAKRLGISYSSVRGYLSQAVGEWLITWSEVAFTVDKRLRDLFERPLRGEMSGADLLESMERALRDGAVVLDDRDVKLYGELRSHILGDSYAILCEIELFMHKFIRATLITQYGDGDNGWWGKGVPESIRRDCAARMEESRSADGGSHGHAFNYSNFIHLKEIIIKNWNLFGPQLPKQYGCDKPRFESDMKRINSIRNAVMHPIRCALPTDADYSFVENILRVLRESDS